MGQGESVALTLIGALSRGPPGRSTRLRPAGRNNLLPVPGLRAYHSALDGIGYRMRTRYCFLCLLLCVPAMAHNGHLALAYPVQGIVVDGDLTDWPGGLPSYPIDLTLLGDRAFDEQDLQASFRIGFAQIEEAIYVAVSVTDQSIMDTMAVETGWQDWDDEDTCEIYLQPVHDDSTSQSWIAVVYGTDAKVFLDGRTLSLSPDAIQVAFTRTDTSHVYEWRFGLAALSNSASVLPGAVLSFDVAIGDADADGTFTYRTWGWGLQKDGSLHRRADVLLVGDEQVGSLAGRLLWAGSQIGVGRELVTVDHEGWDTAIRLATDAEGRFSALLPTGAYSVAPSLGGISNPIEATVRVDTAADLTLTRTPPSTAVVRAGNGVRSRVGDGRRHGPWFSLGVADGLGANAVLSLFQDHKGDLWVGTRGGGVSRFDGGEILTLTAADGLPDNDVLAIHEDRDGNLWFGTGKGVARFDGTSFRNHSTRDGLAGNRVTAIAQDRLGTMWFGTAEGGLSRFDGAIFRTLRVQDGLPANEIRSILAMDDGSLWITTASSGAVRLEQDRFTTFSPTRGLAWHAVGGLTWADDGRVFFGMRDFLLVYDGQRFAEVGRASGYPGDLPTALLHDGQHRLWIGTNTGGLLRQNGPTFERIALDGSRVHCLLQDSEGFVWVGSESGGVSRYDGDVVTTYGPGSGLPAGGLTCLLNDRRGGLWVGTSGGGVSRFDGSTFTTYTTTDGLASNIVYDLLEDGEGRLWITTAAGVGRFDGKQFDTFRIDQELPGWGPRALALDAQSRVLASTDYAGIHRFEEGRFVTLMTRAHLGNVVIFDMHADRSGRLWIAAGSDADGTGYLGRIQDGTVRPLMGYRTHDGVSSFVEGRDGDLWFGTWHSGIGRYDGNDIDYFTTRDGLAHNRVTVVRQDATERLWIGTAAGVSQYDGRVFHHLTTTDGLADNDVRDLLVNADGSVWIATSTGLTHYRPSREPPPVEITGVVAERRLGPVSRMSLSSLQDHVEFEFRGRSLVTQPEQMSYLYRMAGFDGWQVTRRRRVEYDNLPRGDFIFEVLAIDRDLNVSAAAAALAVDVHLPYERITWICVTLLGGLLFLWQTTRIVRRDVWLQTSNRQLANTNLELAGTNRELRETQTQLVQAEKMTTLGVLAGGIAHEINNPLQTILSGARRILRFPEDGQRHGQSAQLIERAAEHCHAIVQSLLSYARRPGSDPHGPVLLDGVVDNTVAFLQHQLDQDGIELQLDRGTPPAVQGDYNELCTVVTNLIMNARDALLTAAAAKDGRWIRVVTRAQDGVTILEVSDNGPGITAQIRAQIFDPFFTTKPVGGGTGLGLSITRSIVERHGGTIAVEVTSTTAISEGMTVFSVRLPSGSSAESVGETARPRSLG